MLLSISLMMILGFSLGGVLNKFRLPPLLGMMIAGIILGPYAMDMISDDILNISTELREIALIVILIRAGLSLDINDLKKVGRPAFLMCFVPALFELTLTTFLAPVIFNISYLEAAIMGSVLAAVSPAVVVPRMIEMIGNGKGSSKKIPQLIMAGASVDDIFVIILFASFLGMYTGSGFDGLNLLKVPLSVILGLATGIVTGLILVKLFKTIHTRDTIKVLIILSISFLLVSLEDYIAAVVPFSGLLAVMALGGTILESYQVLAVRLMGKFSKIWVASEILLFVLVGAAIDIRYVPLAGVSALILIICALIFRIAGVFTSLVNTNLNFKEKLFCAIAYTPKATVQAAIGSIPLSAGVASGNTILTVAVLAIMITAPLGAVGIDRLQNKLL
ncbi:cation:proton antiporter [Alkalibacter mobilis]|uniref:cation:proton antiporter n=1 Tax=Alkalibacter mobilis TaxID=2787712 RepID=UPI00189FFE39|nr:cation:proton antiporter [Alkalibacter mobilis]MBF7096771.1 cation:proton antiporter [Alkalibacter mobilis]